MFVKEVLVSIFVTFHVFFPPLDLSEGGAPRIPGPPLRGRACSGPVHTQVCGGHMVHVHAIQAHAPCYQGYKEINL